MEPKKFCSCDAKPQSWGRTKSGYPRQRCPQCLKSWTTSGLPSGGQTLYGVPMSRALRQARVRAAKAGRNPEVIRPPAPALHKPLEVPPPIVEVVRLQTGFHLRLLRWLQSGGFPDTYALARALRVEATNRWIEDYLAGQIPRPDPRAELFALAQSVLREWGDRWPDYLEEN